MIEKKKKKKEQAEKRRRKRAAALNNNNNRAHTLNICKYNSMRVKTARRGGIRFWHHDAASRGRGRNKFALVERFRRRVLRVHFTHARTAARMTFFAGALLSIPSQNVCSRARVWGVGSGAM